MDNYKEINEAFRRASLISITKPDELVNKLSKDKDKPKDNFYLVHILSLFFGLLSMLPLIFFVTANGYWMYKFRDPATDTVDLNNKTTLQKYFVSGSLVVQTVPSIATMILSATFGHRFKANSRVILSLSLINVIFVVFTIFIKVNTDTWQVGFFAVTLLSLSLITGILNLFQVTAMDIIPKFPPIYMKSFLFGQGMATIFSATLQIISLALGSSTETAALFYFISGTLIMVLSLTLYLLIQRTSFYKYYMQIQLEDTNKKLSKEEIKSTFLLTWPCLAIMVILFLTMNMTHPPITALVVSEFYGNGNRWNEVYFTPTITFLFTEVCSQFGRLLSRPIITKSNGAWIVGMVVLRMIILVPLVLFCNAQPRNYLPVLLPHDWQYILVCIAYFVSSGYLFNIATICVPVLAKGKEDVAFKLLLSVVGISAGVLSPISLLAVRLLCTTFYILLTIPVILTG